MRQQPRSSRTTTLSLRKKANFANRQGYAATGSVGITDFQAPSSHLRLTN
jgi:hypothetical protein